MRYFMQKDTKIAKLSVCLQLKSMFPFHLFSDFFQKKLSYCVFLHCQIFSVCLHKCYKSITGIQWKQKKSTHKKT